MLLGSVLERFVEQSPTTVLAKILLDQALDPAWVDELFESHRQRQYTKTLLFSTTIDLMSLVVLGLQPSIHAAAQASKQLPVTITALYDKIKNTSPLLVRKLVQESAKQLLPIHAELGTPTKPLLPGFKVRIVDGNHLPASEKRLELLRSFRGAARPGYSLVVYEPEKGLVTDLIPCEDAFTHERTTMLDLIRESCAGELWIADRLFSTSTIFRAFAKKDACFLIREHGASPHPSEVDELRKVGRIETGIVYEQNVKLDKKQGDDELFLRRIEIHLDESTEDGDKIIRILTNLPRTEDAQTLARLYRRRWSIESMFQWLEGVLNSEIKTLGYPCGALLAFGIAVLAFNTLSLIRSTTESAHAIDPEDPNGVSLYYVAVEVSHTLPGLCIAVSDEEWQAIKRLSLDQLMKLLMRVAARIDPKKLRKHPRGPKIKKKKEFVAGKIARSQVSTARVLKAGKIVK